jgi:hypothetical protein
VYVKRALANTTELSSALINEPIILVQVRWASGSGSGKETFLWGSKCVAHPCWAAAVGHRLAHNLQNHHLPASPL